MIKKCNKCGQTKSVNDFTKHKGHKDGLAYWCRDCTNENIRKHRSKPDVIEFRKTYTKEYYQKNKERVKGYNDRYHAKEENKKQSYLRNIKRNYGLEPHQYYEMFMRQVGKCAICSVSFGDERSIRPHVDHDHSTGAVRGLLCDGCNKGIGALRDNPRALRKAADYVERGGFSCDVILLPIAVQK